ncbi:MAG: methyltransferase domain-containing protein [Pirellulales bacterium]
MQNDEMPFQNVSTLEEVREFWNRKSCGEVFAEGANRKEQFDSHARARYDLEPHIHSFARFEEGAGKDVLEIGTGMGADHLEWAKAGPKTLTGVDLTPRAISWAKERFSTYGYESNLQVADAENLPFADNSFDIVYSWGVLMSSPDTQQTFREIVRVLRPGGITRIMLYNKFSLVAYMLWARWGVLGGDPFHGLSYYAERHLESPGTKLYSANEARVMLKKAGLTEIDVSTRLTASDLLLGVTGQNHPGALLEIAKRLYPRWFAKRFLKRHGLNLMIQARKALVT